MGISIPSGAAALTLTDSANNNRIYYAAGQLEFTEVPSNGAIITIIDETMPNNPYVFEFVEDPSTYTGTNIAVSNDVPSVSEAVSNLLEAMKLNIPSGDRFTASNNTIKIAEKTVDRRLFIKITSLYGKIITLKIKKSKKT